jgi:four helix bundle protein
MIEIRNTKQFDLEERAYMYAKDCRSFVKTLPRTICNLQDIPQLVRASGSVAANYIEANESLSKKDFAMRVKISRKEAKESRLWLRLVDTQGKQELENERLQLLKEGLELQKILGSIVEKSK